MDEDNIIKKKSKNRNKNYYRRHNNQNRNYYSKNKKKKNLILENSDSEEVKNILLFNEKEREKNTIEKPEIPIIHVEELLKEVEANKMVFDDNTDVIPTKKSSGIKNIGKLFRQNAFKVGVSFAVFLVAILGVSYSYFNYTKTDPRQADISSGEVYVRLVENETSITLSKMYPREDEEARSRNDNYFDFTVKGKNTSEKRDIVYNISVNNGENISGKTRIDPKYIKLDLQEKVNNEYVYLQKGVSLNSYTFTGIIPTNTTNEITKEYRLRIWIGDNVLISDSEPNASYTMAEFSNLYANFDIGIDSEDKVIAYTMFSQKVDTEAVINFGSVSSDSNGKGLYRLLGTENDSFPIYYYRGEVNDNNVIFGGFCWQMVRTTDTGGIKMIYNGVATGNGTTCENTAHADRIISQGAFNSQYNSVSDVGYMKNTRYPSQSTAPSSGAYFGTSIEYGDFDSNGTNEYKLADDGNGSVGTILDANHHYSCDVASATGTCVTIRYYYYVSGTDYRYINLTNGETVEDALYKMTGNGDAEVKARNSSYVLNNTDSTAKTAIESWFRTNLTNEVDSTKRNYASFLEDTVYCNNRSYKTVVGNTNSPTFDQSGWNSNGGDLTKYLYFGTNNRTFNGWYSDTNVPTTVCPNETDRFSVSSSVAHLNYPVGLLTSDEIVMAGASGNSSAANNTYYLYTGDSYLSLSPYRFSGGGYADGFYVRSTGVLNYTRVSVTFGLRPVISLKLGTEFVSGGEGTPTNPYVVKYE